MNETLDKLRTGVKEMLALDEVDIDLPMSQIGIDSLNIVEIIILCQQIYSSVMNTDEINIDDTTTLRELDEQMNSLSMT